MKKNQTRSIVTQTAVCISGIFMITVFILTILFSVFIWKYMQQNILDSKKEQIHTISETPEVRMGKWQNRSCGMETSFVTGTG